MNFNYRSNYNFFIALFANNVGNMLFSFVLPLFILELTNSPMHLSIVTALNTIPYLIASLPFGYFIDHFNKLKTMIFCNICSFFIYLFLAITMQIGLNKTYIIVLIYFVSFTNGLLNVARGISETSIVPELFDEAHIAKANSLVFSTQYLCNTVMPMIGGIIYTKVNISVFALINAVTFLFCSLIMFSMKANHNPNLRNTKNTFLFDFKEGMISGFEIVCKKKMLLLPLIAAACINLMTANFTNDYIYLLKNVFYYSTEKVGIVQSFSAIGALAGSYLISQLYEKYGFNKMFCKMLILISVSMICLIFNGSLYFVSICLAVNALVKSAANILVITNRQFSAPKEYIARADSIYKMVLLGASSFGAILGGTQTSLVGVSMSIVISGGLVFIIAILYKVFNKKMIEN